MLEGLFHNEVVEIELRIDCPYGEDRYVGTIQTGIGSKYSMMMMMITIITIIKNGLFSRPVVRCSFVRQRRRRNSAPVELSSFERLLGSAFFPPDAAQFPVRILLYRRQPVQSNGGCAYRHENGMAHGDSSV